MQLNPKTAAKQWLRKTKKKTTALNPEIENQQPTFFDKWATIRNRFFSGKGVVLSNHKQFERAQIYLNRISKKDKYGNVRFIDHGQNKNKFTQPVT